MRQVKIETPLTLNVLDTVLRTRGWTQNDLADRAGVHRSVVSMHLSRQRPIRDDHLCSYLTALDRHERPQLLGAWLRDTLHPHVLEDVCDAWTGRIAEKVATWSPGLDEEQRQMLDWWAAQLARDRELDQVFRAITRRAGWRPLPAGES